MIYGIQIACWYLSGCVTEFNLRAKTKRDHAYCGSVDEAKRILKTETTKENNILNM